MPPTEIPATLSVFGAPARPVTVTVLELGPARRLGRALVLSLPSVSVPPPVP